MIGTLPKDEIPPVNPAGRGEESGGAVCAAGVASGAGPPIPARAGDSTMELWMLGVAVLPAEGVGAPCIPSAVKVLSTVSARTEDDDGATPLDEVDDWPQRGESGSTAGSTTTSGGGPASPHFAAFAEESVITEVVTDNDSWE